MTGQETPAAGDRDVSKEALNNRLQSIGWGLFLIMLGGLWLAPKEMIPEGAWLVGTGLIILGLSLVRYLNGMQLSWVWIVLGVLALGTGLGDIVGLNLPVFPILLIIAGVATLFRVFFPREQG